MYTHTLYSTLPRPDTYPAQSDSELGGVSQNVHEPLHQNTFKNPLSMPPRFPLCFGLLITGMMIVVLSMDRAFQNTVRQKTLQKTFF